MLGGIEYDFIFDSWNNDRAILYRKLHNIDNNMGTAVVIQEMVNSSHFMMY